MGFGYPWKTEQTLAQEFLKPPWGLRLGKKRWAEGFQQEAIVGLQNDPAKNEGKGFQREGIPWV